MEVLRLTIDEAVLCGLYERILKDKKLFDVDF